jgi:hypothetical protein
MLGKQSVARLRNNSDIKRSVFNAVSAIPGTVTVNTSAIIEGIFCVWSVPRVYREQQRSFASSHRSEAESHGHEAVMKRVEISVLYWSAVQCSAV